MSGPNKENPATSIYFFVQGLQEVGEGSRIQEIGERTDDKITKEVGENRRQTGLKLIDEAINLNISFRK